MLDPRLKVHVLQCHDEPGRKSNQFKKTVSKIKDIFSIGYDATNVREPLFRLEDAELTETTEPADNESKAKFMRWELGMNKHFEDENFIKEGKFSLWSMIIGH